MTTHVVSFSELSSIRQCRLQAHLSYRERWRTETVSAALSRGKLFHAVMEARNRAKCATLSGDGEKRAVDPYDVLKEAEGSYDEDVIETVTWMLEGYEEQWGEDSQWDILAVEEKVEDWLRLPSGRRSQFKLKGFVDLLVRDRSAGGGLWVVDYKTCRELPKRKALDFDDQFGIYIWLLRKKGLDVRGCIYSAVRTNKLKRSMTLDERFCTEYTVRTDRELEVMAGEALETFRSAYGVGVRGQVGGDKLPPRSPDPDRCGWRCPFTESCLMSRKGRDIRELLAETGFTQSYERH